MTEETQTIEEFLAEMDDKIILRGKNVKTDISVLAGKMGHRKKALKYGLKINKTRQKVDA